MVDLGCVLQPLLEADKQPSDVQPRVHRPASIPAPTKGKLVFYTYWAYAKENMKNK